MTELVQHRVDAGVATITLDDGKVNALSPAMLTAIGAALDAAEHDDATSAVVLTGRERVFSAGFDLDVLRGGGEAMVAMNRQGFDLSHRLLSFPKPVVIACNGHAMAMGSFLLLSADYRIGVAGADHRIVANEVAIGIVMPEAAIELCRHRLIPAAFERAVGQSELFHPDDAVATGWLDATVPAAQLAAAATERAAALGSLDARAYAGTKARTRGPMLARYRAAIEADEAALRAFL
jgi:enoyl-CoA hydratase